MIRLAQVILLSACLTGGLGEESERTGAKEPLVYTRLRHDTHYLQVFRNLQLEKPHEERALRTGELTYYENEQVDASKLTYDDLVFEALDRTYKTRLMPAYIHAFDRPEDRARSSDPRLVSVAKCARELAYLRAELAQYKRGPAHPELAAFFDSYAGEEPGLLLGNYHWSGNWRQCNKRHLFRLRAPAEPLSFRGRYCVASVRSGRWQARIGRQLDQLRASGYFRRAQQPAEYDSFFRIQIGLCLPESCDSSSIFNHSAAIRALALHKLGQPFQTYNLSDLFCLPDEDSELRQFEPAGLALLGLALVWLALVAALTCADRAQQPARARSTLGKLAAALSVRRNIRRLLETDSIWRAIKLAEPAAEAPPTHLPRPEPAAAKLRLLGEPKRASPSDLIFLNALKVICVPAIIYGHTGMLGVHLNRFPLDYDSYESPLLFHFSASAVFFVDFFFAISGFLTAYTMFATNKVNENSPGQWLHSIFHRYWRLAPSYLLLFYFGQYLFQHLSHGPVWDYGTSNMTLRAICRAESSVWPLLLVPNLHPIHEECIMPAWYIGSDMQFYLITPLLLLALAKSPALGWLLCLGLLSASIGARVHRYLSDPRAQPLELMRPRFDLYMRNNWDMHPTYLYPHYRLPSYLVGLLGGHYAFLVRTGRRASRAAGGCARTLLWLLGLATVCAMMFATGLISGLFPRALEPQVRYFTALIYGLSHTQAALGLTLVLVTFTLGQFGALKRALSHPFWTLISRLNYFVFLVQVELIYLLYQSGERVGDFSAREAFKQSVLVLVLSYSLSFVVALLFEMPLANLEREFIGSRVAAHARNRKRPDQEPSAAGRRARGAATLSVESAH